ncbi:hypothetical protein [Lactiplantibacillus plantarum]|uniref:hypothetical protein n=1 Tax=Lactiplantibacillus plantarum TaxID=1590 RepID=UPI000B14612D|nr:hypothetical protein [Lactiplantibacillus plantarum]MCG0572352.1 hypothetical protein [Lactiplantibacillus plantarum]MCG0783186.1 hypothetical protein [Lactiplantibacillus plantarum]MCG0809997.1 hypothetical protein [Lactiplantibacillus plantarum]UTD41549.1 hypothetical protein H5V40_04505 [Lactiplantibacillus plantarum]
MSDEMKELRRRLINDAIGCQEEDDTKTKDGIIIALFEMEHLNQPYFGTDYSQGDGGDD